LDDAAMTRDDINRLLAKAVSTSNAQVWTLSQEQLEQFAVLVAAAEREACAKVCEEKTAYQMQIPCPDGIPGCLVFHAIEARREKTGSECAAAIRARGNA
jgi:hypothetical protein